MINCKIEYPRKIISYCKKYAYSRCQFVSILERYNDEILQRVFAFQKYVDSDLQIMEVMRRVSNGKIFFVRESLYFVNLNGYLCDFRCCEWRYLADNLKCPIGLNSYCLNSEIIEKTKYKYCFYLGGYVNPIDYFNVYTKYPGLELLSKIGIPMSLSLLKKAQKDKLFCKFLYKNSSSVCTFGVSATLFAYKYNLDIDIAYDFLHFRSLYKYNDLNFKENERQIFFYLRKNKIGFYSYRDYFNACNYLNLDMSLSKNLFPHDFKLMHDLRIQEFNSKKAKENLKERRAFYKNFRQVSNKYSFLNYTGDYSIIIAPTVQSLIHEGKILNHCVGRMGYDEKMVNEKSLIFFIRRNEDLKKPFVTVEFSLETKEILQIYGYDDELPNSSVIKFSKHWEKLAKNRIVKFNKK